MLDLLARKKARPFGTLSSLLLNIGHSGEERVLGSVLTVVIEDKSGGVETSGLTAPSEEVSLNALPRVVFGALGGCGFRVEDGFVDLLRVTVCVVREQLFPLAIE